MRIIVMVIIQILLMVLGIYDVTYGEGGIVILGWILVISNAIGIGINSTNLFWSNE